MAINIGKEYKEIASKILGCTLASYYNWSKHDRPIIALLEKYFTKEDLEEFLETGKIQKQELVKNLNYDELLEFIHINDKTMAEYASVPVETIQDWRKNKPELINTIIQSLVKKGEQ